MRVTNRMGLTVWDDGDDLYDHNQLADNWDAVDAHDHTPGKGAPLGTGSLADGSVTSAKLAPNSVTSAHIVNGTIQGEDIADGAIPASKLDQSFLGSFVPLGSVVPWFRPNTTVNVPTGWVLCVGQDLQQADHDWSGAGTVHVPDLRDSFVMGVAAGSDERTTGGSNSRTWSQTVNLPDHTHQVPTHNHQVGNHTHTVTAHSHSITEHAGHRHNWNGGPMHQRAYEIYQGINWQPRQGAFVPGVNTGDTGAGVEVPMDTGGRHDHGGDTGSASPTTSAAGAGFTSGSGTLTTTGPTPTGTASVNVGGDTRPAFVGLLYIMKVRRVTT